MPIRKNKIGLRFSRLLVTGFVSDSEKGAKRWQVVCDCGESREVFDNNLAQGITKSCGCYRNEQLSKATRKHGKAGSGEYQSWNHAKQRCYNPKDSRFARYGGRGIKMCPAWRESFEAFFQDMGDRPEGTTLDRINNDGHYEPGNCRWATAETQLKNRRYGK